MRDLLAQVIESEACNRQCNVMLTGGPITALVETQRTTMMLGTMLKLNQALKIMATYQEYRT